MKSEDFEQINEDLGKLIDLNDSELENIKRFLYLA